MKERWVVADFETTGKNYLEEKGRVDVWLWAISSPDGTILSWGKDIESFMDYCRSNLKSTKIYFHNLRFDGSFILSYLLENKFERKDKILHKDNRGFSCLIGEMGEFYEIKVNFRKDRQVTFLDSLKVLPFKVEQIAKDFDLPVKKGSIDYNDYTIDDERLEYVFNDVKIVALALSKIKAEGIERMTTASSAYHSWKDICPLGISLLPELDDEFLLNFREAYRGGRSQVNPKYANKVLNGVLRFDINSMYPYIMHDLPLPYGKPISLNGRTGRYLFELYKVKIGFNLKNGHLPSLLKKGGIYNSGDTYYKDTEGIEEIYISNIDLDLVKRNYDVYYLEILEGYGFHTTTCLFKAYIDKWYAVKNNSKGAPRLVAKLMLNSLYGKFGSKFIGYVKEPVLKDGVVCFEKSDEVSMKKYYLPIAIAITSWAHKLLDDRINELGVDNFVYCDTDSIHCLKELNPEYVDQKELGKFKLEGIEETSKYVRQKCYVYTEDGNVNITCAGLTPALKEKAIEKYGMGLFDVFETGFEIEGKLIPKRVKGGVILEETSYKIK